MPDPKTHIPEQTVWYGTQTIFVDFAAAMLLVISARIPLLGFVALAAFMLGPPLVHFFQRQKLKAAASLALRIFVPLIGAVLYGRQFGDSSWLSGAVDGLIGAVLGVVAAVLIDWIVLSRGATDKESSKPIDMSDEGAES